MHIALRGRILAECNSRSRTVHADGLLVVKAGQIEYVGPFDEAGAYRTLTCVNVPLMTPGLVDAHTHSAWVGSRHQEMMLKLRGASYEEIAANGGGIAASMVAIERASVREIYEQLRARLLRMASLGVSTVEVKTGYGLRRALEEKQLEALSLAQADLDLPRVIPTWLALHALPPEARGSAGLRKQYIDNVLHWSRELAQNHWIRFVDAYIDRNAFSCEEARPVLEEALSHGLRSRLHVGQFADVGGAKLAAALGAVSVDHMEHVSLDDMHLLAEHGIHTTLLPIASWMLSQASPNIAQLRDAGTTMVVASDANPGTAPSESLLLAMFLAIKNYGLSPDEVWAAATVHAATSLLLPKTGALREHWNADVVVWNVDHEDDLLAPWGTSRAELTLCRGRVIWDANQLFTKTQHAFVNERHEEERK